MGINMYPETAAYSNDFLVAHAHNNYCPQTATRVTGLDLLDLSSRRVDKDVWSIRGLPLAGTSCTCLLVPASRLRPSRLWNVRYVCTPYHCLDLYFAHAVVG